MSFAWPWIFLLLPLPWLLRRLLAPVETAPSLRVPSLPVIDVSAPKFRWTAALWWASLAWLLLVTAAARPQIPNANPPQPVSGRDMLLAVDVSASMATADLELDGKPAARLRVAQMLAGEFLERRQSDRVGLIVFGSQAYLHTPLTHDLTAVGEALAGMEAGLAGRETALGDAMALATKHLKALPGNSRVLVILTDGANNAGTLTPGRAAWLARREGVRIHAVAIGALPAPAAARGSGTTVNAGSELDEESLREAARQTGGIYLRAADSAALEDFLQRLDSIEPTVRGVKAVHTMRELYVWPLAIGFALSFCLAWCRRRTDNS